MLNFVRFNQWLTASIMKNVKIALKISLLLLFISACTGKEKQSDDQSDTLDKDNYLEAEINLETATAKIYGSLKTPTLGNQFPLVLIIAGSGPTDRNGNNTAGLRTDTYKMISDTLVKHGIASLRYDKRGIAKSYYTGFQESDVVFDDYVDDAVEWIKKLSQDNRFSQIFILGHSEGSLIGMIAAQKVIVAGYISVAGTSQSADELILEQLATQPFEIIEEAKSIISSLKQGIQVPDVSQSLYALFRPSIQPYMISWFKYDPKVEISKLTLPVLIVHGTTDLQVKSAEAQDLAKAKADAQLAVIEYMNHVLKDAGEDYQANLATYSNPALPLNSEFCKVIVEFLKEKSRSDE
jgi:alpha/beta superfamily hydrolase